jgi:ribosomal protein S18 acetylase RimI-like enzyme
MAVTVPQIDLREIEPTDDAALRAVADLHTSLMSFGPLAPLGPGFLRVVAYRAPMRERLLRVAMAEVDGEPVGFVAFTEDSAAFHAEAMRRHWFLAGSRLLGALVKDPRRLRAVPRISRVMRSRVYGGGGAKPFGEVIGLAALPDAVNAEFRKRTGRWISRDLIAYAAQELHKIGRTELRMFVAAENTATLLLYQFLGARFEPLKHGGEPTIAVTFDLPTGELRGG